MEINFAWVRPCATFAPRLGGIEMGMGRVAAAAAGVFALLLTGAAQAPKPQETLAAPPLSAHPAPSPAPTAALPGPEGHALDRTDLEAWLDGVVPYGLKSGDIAGAVVVVVKDGQVLLEKG